MFCTRSEFRRFEIFKAVLSKISISLLFLTVQTLWVTAVFQPSKQNLNVDHNLKFCNGKGKGKVHPRTGHEGPEEE
jgi:hypothetical protein